MAINKPRTDKHCLYEYTLDQEAQIAAAKSLPFKAENVKVYNFAEEHKSLESFTEDFKIMSREVLKLEPGDTALVPCDVHLRICRNWPAGMTQVLPAYIKRALKRNTASAASASPGSWDRKYIAPTAEQKISVK